MTSPSAQKTIPMTPAQKAAADIWSRIHHYYGVPADSLPPAWIQEVVQSALDAAVEKERIPEGWMRDRKQVEELAVHLESVGWQPDSRGDPDCVDQGAAMAAEVIRKVLLPALESPKEK